MSAVASPSVAFAELELVGSDQHLVRSDQLPRTSRNTKA